jgi:hypothetical protein
MILIGAVGLFLIIMFFYLFRSIRESKALPKRKMHQGRKNNDFY